MKVCLIEPLDFFEKWKSWMEEEKGITYSPESKSKNIRGFFAEFLIKLSNSQLRRDSSLRSLPAGRQENGTIGVLS